MNRLILLPAVAALALAACGRGDETTDTANDSATALNSENAVADDAANASGSGTALAATEFAATMAAGDMFEIESGRLAEKNGVSPAVKSFAAMLVADHQKSSTELKAAASQARPAVAVMPELTADQRAKLDALGSAKGAEFDRLFVEQQKEAHGKALEALKSYSANGDVEPLKAFAGKAAPVVQKHLDELNKMKL
ncbi:DUF4142 domain-containing protein [Sphingomonas mesophila]|uniref:DUF4142 domain-containing protein n=1 Tax=Sphingomonas mesophila TaxID=2303576 RepID=UPI000E57243B|nr:DUF4142 domain-containing protein [Sphingomonas mesophila]